LVEHCVAWGADGVVCSALELESIRRNFPSLYTVVPGIRPDGYVNSVGNRDDQSRVATPALAHALGADAIVMGRPIIEAADPRAVAESVLRDLTLKSISA